MPFLDPPKQGYLHKRQGHTQLGRLAHAARSPLCLRAWQKLLKKKAGGPRMARQEHPNPVKWSTQNHASRSKKAAATISAWDCPLLTFYPGFDCGSFKWKKAAASYGWECPLLILHLSGFDCGSRDWVSDVLELVPLFVAVCGFKGKSKASTTNFGVPATWSN